MQIRIIPPNYQLASYVNQLWRFESDEGISQQDSRLIVPNGTAKFILPLRNSVTLRNNYTECKLGKNQIYYFGVTDVATEISAPHQATVIIGVDINPYGIARILPATAKNFKNQVLSIEQLLEEEGAIWQKKLNNITDLAHTIYFLQNMVYHLLDTDKKKFYVFDYCIQLINNSNGNIEINRIVEITGYTKRYLAMLFNEFLGLPPKVYASVIRFNRLYESWAKTEKANFYSDFMYDYYFDQAHFIKEFKKFTGYSPLKFSSIGNEYGKLFYNDFPFLQSYG